MRRYVAAFLWQLALPGAALLFAAWRDRHDGRPDYVVPWIVFAGILWAAWSVPVGSSPPRLRRVRVDIPFWAWPWLALAGVLLYPR